MIECERRTGVTFLLVSGQHQRDYNSYGCDREEDWKKRQRYDSDCCSNSIVGIHKHGVFNISQAEVCNPCNGKGGDVIVSGDHETCKLSGVSSINRKENESSATVSPSNNHIKGNGSAAGDLECTRTPNNCSVSYKVVLKSEISVGKALPKHEGGCEKIVVGDDSINKACYAMVPSSSKAHSKAELEKYERKHQGNQSFCKKAVSSSQLQSPVKPQHLPISFRQSKENNLEYIASRKSTTCVGVTPPINSRSRIPHRSSQSGRSKISYDCSDGLLKRLHDPDPPINKKCGGDGFPIVEYSRR
eukprot:Gb_17526 [translate_table: standard]